MICTPVFTLSMVSATIARLEVLVMGSTGELSIAREPSLELWASVAGWINDWNHFFSVSRASSSCPSISILVVGRLRTYVYWLKDCGSLRSAYGTGIGLAAQSGVMNRDKLLQ